MLSHPFVPRFLSSPSSIETDLLPIRLSDVYCPTSDYLHLLRCSFQLGQHSCTGKGYTMLQCSEERGRGRERERGMAYTIFVNYDYTKPFIILYLSLVVRPMYIFVFYFTIIYRLHLYLGNALSGPAASNERGLPLSGITTPTPIMIIINPFCPRD